MAQGDPNDAVLARNAQLVFAAVVVHLRQAPSLSYTDQCVETIDGLTRPTSALASTPTRPPIPRRPSRCAAESSPWRSS